MGKAGESRRKCRKSELNDISILVTQMDALQRLPLMVALNINGQRLRLERECDCHAPVLRDLVLLPIVSAEEVTRKELSGKRLMTANAG